MFEFKILAKDKKSKARIAEFTTPHGKLLTPQLAFVATEGEIKCIPKEILSTLPVNLIIVNTFHLWVKKILDKFYNFSNDRGKSCHTIHDYLKFKKAVMSDSGGFQVFSLGFGKTHKIGKVTNIFPLSVRHPERNARSKWSEGSHNDLNNPLKIKEEGVTFTWENKEINLTPEKSIQLQQKIGADIIFAFDECTSPLNSHEYTKKSMQRTHRWLKRCLKKKTSNKQALFGIVQGGYFEDLRVASAKFVGKQDVPGFGIGGSFGPTKEDMYGVLEWTIPLLPDEKPRHFLGIGTIKDIFKSVELGIDLFDCVIPTREARHKVLYTNYGRINLKKMKNTDEVIEKNCRCEACSQKITFRQLYQFFLQKDSRAHYFSTVHNIHFYSDLMEKIRKSIELNSFQELKEKLLQYY